MFLKKKKKKKKKKIQDTFEQNELNALSQNKEHIHVLNNNSAFGN